MTPEDVHVIHKEPPNNKSKSTVQNKGKDGASQEEVNKKLFIIGEYIKRRFYIDCYCKNDTSDNNKKILKILSQEDILEFIKDNFFDSINTSSFDEIYDYDYQLKFDFSNVYEFITGFIKYKLDLFKDFIKQLPERNELFNRISLSSYSPEEDTFVNRLLNNKYELEMYIYSCACCRIFECEESQCSNSPIGDAIFSYYYENNNLNNIPEDNFFFLLYKTIIEKYSMFFCDLSDLILKNPHISDDIYINSHIPNFFTYRFKKSTVTEDDIAFSRYRLFTTCDNDTIFLKTRAVTDIAENLNLTNKKDKSKYLNRCICGISIWDYVYFRKKCDSARMIFLKIIDKATIYGIKTNITVVGLPKKPEQLEGDTSGLKFEEKKKLVDDFTNAKIKCCQRLYEEADMNIRTYRFLQEGSI